MLISLIVAASENGVIGKDNKLPWHLPDDLKRFKELTKGKTIIMGRKTYESIGRPLPDRRNIVLSSTVQEVPGTEVVSDLDSFLSRLETELPDEDEVFVIGGSDLFNQWLADAFFPYTASRVYLTRVHAEIEGDAVFPDLDGDHWIETERIEHAKDEKHEHAFSFVTYDRVQ